MNRSNGDWLAVETRAMLDYSGKHFSLACESNHVPSFVTRRQARRNFSGNAENRALTFDDVSIMR